VKVFPKPGSATRVARSASDIGEGWGMRVSDANLVSVMIYSGLKQYCGFANIQEMLAL
jgi:hypothetical protein